MGSAGLQEDADALYVKADAFFSRGKYAEAFALSMLAANAGHPAACSLVGVCYANGFGTDKDVPTAQIFFEKAASGGLPRGRRNFAIALMDPSCGPPDYRKAVEQLTYAIELGDERSFGILARLYMDGIGVEKGLGKAVGLLRRGADARDPQALYDLSECYRTGVGVHEAASMKEVPVIYKAVKSLTKRYGRKFTPDGVLLGTLGEVLAEEKYDLKLLSPKTKDFDATDCRGRKVQIRCNQRNTTPIKKGATKGVFLALKLLPDGSIKEIFNGPASAVHQLTVGRKADSAGFVELSHDKLRKLMESVPESKMIPLRRRPQ